MFWHPRKLVKITAEKSFIIYNNEFEFRAFEEGDKERKTEKKLSVKEFEDLMKEPCDLASLPKFKLGERVYNMDLGKWLYRIVATKDFKNAHRSETGGLVAFAYLL